MSAAATLDRWPLVGRRMHVESFTDALLDPQTSGFAISGLAGVGKTRLLDECRLTAEIEGCSTIRIIGSRASATVPLGAFAAVLPASARTAPGVIETEEQLYDALREVAASGDLVVVVDDAHLLDASSTAIVDRLVREQLAFVLATMRSDEAPAAPLSWVHDAVTVLELDALTRTDVDTLLHLALGGPLEGRTGAQLWDITQGNALYIRELTLGAIDSGTLVDDGGVWHLTAPLATNNRLRDLIEHRIRASGAEGREALEIVVLAQPLGRSELERLVPAAVVDALEASGLIQIEIDGRRHTVTIAHALHADVIREGLPTTRRRNLLRDNAARIEALGARRADDAVRVAVWRLDSDGRADAAVLVGAARLARAAHQWPEVERLARAARLDDPMLPEAAFLLGEASYELGAFDVAEQVLADAQALAQTDHDRVVGAVLRSRNRFSGLLDAPGSIAVLEAARSQLTSREGRDELLSEQASRLVYSGHPAQGLHLVQQLEPLEPPAQPDGDPGAGGDGAPGARSARGAPADGGRRARVLHAYAASPALTLMGRTTEAVALAERAYEEHMALGDVLVIGRPGVHIAAQVFALTHAGRLNEAEQLGRAGHAIGVNEGIPGAQIWFALELGTVAALRGRPRTSLTWFREARACAKTAGARDAQRTAANGVALAAAQLGDVVTAHEALAEIDAVAGINGFVLNELALGQAWTAAAAGHPDEAVGILLRQAATARASDNLTFASWLWHDALRIDPRAAVADLLAEVAARGDSPILSARADHADAVRRGDRHALAQAVGAFEALGLALEAAEAAFATADAFRLAGEQRTASVWVGRGERLLEECEAARTPRSVQVDTVVPLSKRERDVALLAAQGVQSKDIAERLGLSVRTVNNHLQRAYTKLGISNRGELADILGPATDDEGGTAR